MDNDDLHHHHAVAAADLGPTGKTNSKTKAKAKAHTGGGGGGYTAGTGAMAGAVAVAGFGSTSEATAGGGALVVTAPSPAPSPRLLSAESRLAQEKAWLVEDLPPYCHAEVMRSSDFVWSFRVSGLHGTLYQVRSAWCMLLCDARG